MPRGAWKASRAVSDVQEPVGGNRPELHDQTDWAAPGAEPPYAAPRQVQLPPNIGDDGTGYDPVQEWQAPGKRYNVEPVTHDDPATPRGPAGHQLDRGNAEQKRRYTTSNRDGMRVATEARITDYAPSGSRAAMVRGANAQPENNPDGYRAGRRMFRWEDRRMPRRPLRHDVRPLRPVIAVGARDTEPPPGGSTRYSSPFADGARVAGRMLRTPMVRRSPGTWDESTLTDGTTDQPAGTGNPFWTP